MYAPIKMPQIIWSKTDRNKSKNRSTWNIIGDFNILLSVINRSNREKSVKISVLNTINQFELIVIYRKLHTNYSKNKQKQHSLKETIWLDRNLVLMHFKRLSMSSAHNWIRLKINFKRMSGEQLIVGN